MVAVKDFEGLAEDFDLLLGEGFLFLFVLLFLRLADNVHLGLRLFLVSH